MANGIMFPYGTNESFKRDLLADKPEVTHSFWTRGKAVIAVWYGGESHIGHWFTANGREIAIVTRYKGDDAEHDLYIADEWREFFKAHEFDFYDNWAADDWK